MAHNGLDVALCTPAWPVCFCEAVALHLTPTAGGRLEYSSIDKPIDKGRRVSPDRAHAVWVGANGAARFQVDGFIGVGVA